MRKSEMLAADEAWKAIYSDLLQTQKTAAFESSGFWNLSREDLAP